MLMKTRKTNLEDVAELAFFDELNEEPESESVCAMHQKLTYQKVHSLNIISLIIVASESP